MSFKVGDICYIVTECTNLSQFDDETYCPVSHAENLKVIEVKVTVAEGIFIKRNGNTRMEYQIESIDKKHAYDVKRSSAYAGREKRVWYKNALFPTFEAAEEARQKQLVTLLEESEGDFNSKLNSIRELIKS